MTGVILIVPPIVETEATGFRLAAEKTLHRSLWRVEFWRQDTWPRIFKNGEPIPVSRCPEYAARFCNRVARNFLPGAA